MGGITERMASATPLHWHLHPSVTCPCAPGKGGWTRRYTVSHYGINSTEPRVALLHTVLAGPTLAANSNPWVDLAASAGDARAVTEGRADDRQMTASAAVQGGSEGRVTARRRMPLRHQLFLSVPFLADITALCRPASTTRRVGGRRLALAALATSVASLMSDGSHQCVGYPAPS